MEHTHKAAHTVDLAGLRRQPGLDELDDEPALRGAPFTRCLAKAFIKRAGKGDVLPNVSCHNAIIHTTVTLLHTMGRAQSERLADVLRGVHHGTGEIGPNPAIRALDQSPPGPCALMRQAHERLSIVVGLH